MRFEFYFFFTSIFWTETRRGNANRNVHARWQVKRFGGGAGLRRRRHRRRGLLNNDKSNNNNTRRA